jgi:hypothetical protein
VERYVSIVSFIYSSYYLNQLNRVRSVAKHDNNLIISVYTVSTCGRNVLLGKIDESLVNVDTTGEGDIVSSNCALHDKLITPICHRNK